VTYASVTFIALLAALFIGMVYTPHPSAYPIITVLGLIFAGATGALIRAALWGAGANHPLASLVLGAVAGFVVGLAYLIPQWVGAPGVLEPKGPATLAEKRGFTTYEGEFRRETRLSAGLPGALVEPRILLDN
jgi:hypothetical protein